MGTPDLDKICNIAGYPIYKWTVDQLNMRAEKGAVPKRDDSNLSYQSNKGAWLRVISSTNLNKDANDPEAKLTKHVKSLMPDTITDISKDNLAKYFILYGGTATWNKGSMGLRSGIKSGGAYNILGDGEVQEFGYKPMPGITSATVETLGRLGVLRQATIKFKVMDKRQLDLMDVLYFRLGYTLIIEWGQNSYYNNKGQLKSSEEYMINPFSANCQTPEDVLIQLNIGTQKSDGNYGGMFGVITNFEFSLTQDGSYDCSIKVLSMGAAFGNMPINRPSILAKVYEKELSKFLNKEAEDKLTAERLRLQKQQEDAVSEAYKQLNTDEWARILYLDQGKMDAPLVGDPIATLIYNTKNLPTKYNAFLTNTVNTVADPKTRLVYNSLNIENTIYRTDDDLEKVREYVSEYKRNHDMSYAFYYSGTYYMEDRANYGPIIYVEKFNRYIAGRGEDSGTTVQLNLGDEENVKGLLVDSNLLKSTVNIEGIELSSFYVKYEGSKKGALDDLRSLNPAPDAITQKLYYSVKFRYPVGKKNEAIKLFGNSSTKYEVVRVVEDYYLDKYIPGLELKAIGDNVEGYYVELGLGEEGNNQDWVSIVDFGMITSIEPPKGTDLTKNQEFDNYTIKVKEAETKANAEYLTIGEGLEFDIIQTKKTIESSSAIELMLKSVLLYGISENTNTNEFIKQLFSEGAYSQFFSNGFPFGVVTKDIFQKYISGNLTKEKRLLVNLLYGNNYQLLSCENVYNSNGGVKELYKTIPTVDFRQLMEVTTVSYGETPLLGSTQLLESEHLKKSVYINLGHFLLMLNHTAVLYISDNKKSEVITPLSYIDFNPGTNFYLSSANHMSIDPYKFLIGYHGTEDDYKYLFDESLLEGNKIKVTAAQTSNTTDTVTKIPVTSPRLFNPEIEDQLTYILPKNQKKNLQNEDNSYVGRLMDVKVNVNYLLKIIKQYSTNNNAHEAYFQSVIERILDDLFKSFGAYNAFSLSYNDNGNCFHIMDGQIQPADKDLINVHSSMIKGTDSYEIPMYYNNKKSSVVRGLEVRTDISNRITSMIAIAANPTLDTQTGLGRDNSDFGIYNLGTEDRYKKYTTDSKKIGPTKDIKDNGQMAEIAANFNNVVRKTYSTFSGLPTKQQIKLTDEEIDAATNYYIERMSYVKNEQSGSVHSLVIPIKSSVTIDGLSSIYPFQLYTLPEAVLPYRYSVSNLNKKVAYSISRIVHTFDKTEWTTQFDGFMTLLKDADYYKKSKELRKIKKPIKPATKEKMRDTLDTSPIDTERFAILTPEFLKKLDEVCGRLGCKRDDMLRVMYAESGLNPRGKNPESSAAGLIQILKINYPLVKVQSRQQILQASPLTQLDYVERYFERFSGALGDLYLLYGATFQPYRIQYHIDDDNYVLAEVGSEVAVKNKRMQSDKGNITIASFKQYVRNISYEINE